MDINKLDEIVEKFMNDSKLYVETLPIVVEFSKNILKQQIPTVNKEQYSKYIELNDSIKIIYSFLSEIDSNMAEQFMNILKSTDENNKPYVNFYNKNDNPNGYDEVRDGRVFIYLENSSNDLFVILHEMLHKMNECAIINENDQIMSSFNRDYFSELVSITGEMMLGNYLVKNNIIIENDLNIRKRARLQGTKENARDIIIENELIKLKQQNKKINVENLYSVLNQYDKETIEYMVLNDERNDLNRIRRILNNNKLSLIRSQRYVIAVELCNELLSRNTLVEDFIKLHYALGNPNSDIMDTVNELNFNKTL